MGKERRRIRESTVVYLDKILLVAMESVNKVKTRGNKQWADVKHTGVGK